MVQRGWMSVVDGFLAGGFHMDGYEGQGGLIGEGLTTPPAAFRNLTGCATVTLHNGREEMAELTALMD